LATRREEAGEGVEEMSESRRRRARRWCFGGSRWTRPIARWDSRVRRELLGWSEISEELGRK